MLHDKLYANFTNKAFDAACEELLSGVIGTVGSSHNTNLENRILRTYEIPPQNGKYAIVIEFGVRITPSEGLHIAIDLGAPYLSVIEWFAPPNQPQMPSPVVLNLFNTQKRQEPPIFERIFKAPTVTSTLSYYIRFESDVPFDIKQVGFLDGYDREP